MFDNVERYLSPYEHIDICSTEFHASIRLTILESQKTPSSIRACVARLGRYSRCRIPRQPPYMRGSGYLSRFASIKSARTPLGKTPLFLGTGNTTPEGAERG